MSGRAWTPEEDAILRDVYACEPYPALAAYVRLPGRSYDTIRSHARNLGITNRHRKIKPPTSIPAAADVDPADRHPKGWVRPILCPFCREVLTVPADPRAA